MWGAITTSFVVASFAVLLVTGFTARVRLGGESSFWMAGMLLAMQLGTAFWCQEYDYPDALHLAPALDAIGCLAAGLLWRNSRTRWSFLLSAVFFLASGSHVVFFAVDIPGRLWPWIYQFVLNVLSAVQLIIVLWPALRDGFHARHLLLRSRRRRVSGPGHAAASPRWRTDRPLGGRRAT